MRRRVLFWLLMVRTTMNSTLVVFSGRRNPTENPSDDSEFGISFGGDFGSGGGGPGREWVDEVLFFYSLVLLKAQMEDSTTYHGTLS